MPPVEHPQDWTLVAEALAQFAGDPNQLETPREERAYELVEAIAAAYDMRPGEFVQQADSEWRGPE